MKTECPFCKEPYEINLDHLNRHLVCYNCNNKFKCVLVTIPKIGAMYLNIETTDDPVQPGAEVFNIVWWCNNQWYSWVKGQDQPDEFRMFWEHTPWIVTFDGKDFEEPLLCRQFNLRPQQYHIELREEAKKQGMSGGLKALGEVFGLPRDSGQKETESQTSVDLWHTFEKEHSPKALSKMLCDNAWKVVQIYHLHCHFTKITPLPMQDSIPFKSAPPAVAVPVIAAPAFAPRADAKKENETPKKVIIIKKWAPSVEKKIFVKKNSKGE